MTNTNTRANALQDLINDHLDWIERRFGDKFANDVAFEWGSRPDICIAEAEEMVAREHGYEWRDGDTLERIALRMEAQEARQEQMDQMALAHGF